MWPLPSTKELQARVPVEAVVAPPGSTVVLRAERTLNEAEKAMMHTYLKDLNDGASVRFVMFESLFQACVIGAPE